VGYLAKGEVNGSAVHAVWLWQHASWLATAGRWAVGAMAVALIALGRRAYSDPATRRTVGILWDLGTFWPRATHPLAPPCYCERALPDLIDRMTWLAPGKTVRQVEDGLMKFVPDEFKADAHHWLILHGRYVCLARSPRCG
jgi:hypothetical protein